MPTNETTVQTIQDSHTIVQQNEDSLQTSSVVSEIQANELLETENTVSQISQEVTQQIVQVTVEQSIIQHTVVFSAGYAGPGLPSGGEIGMIPVKSSLIDYDVEWQFPSATGIEEAPNDGQKWVRQNEDWAVETQWIPEAPQGGMLGISFSDPYITFDVPSTLSSYTNDPGFITTS